MQGLCRSLATNILLLSIFRDKSVGASWLKGLQDIEVKKPLPYTMLLGPMGEARYFPEQQTFYDVTRRSILFLYSDYFNPEALGHIVAR